MEHKTEELTLHPQCALRTVPVYAFSVYSSSAPAAVVLYADPPPCIAWGHGGVTNQHASSFHPTVCVGIPGAVKLTAAFTLAPQIPEILLTVPPRAIPGFQTPEVAAPVPIVQANPSHLSRAPRSESSGGTVPSSSSGSTGHNYSGLPPGGPHDDLHDDELDKKKRDNQFYSKRKSKSFINSEMLTK